MAFFQEFLTDRRQRIVVVGATNEWIPIVSGAPHGSVFVGLLFCLCTSEMFDLVENRMFAYADDSTLLAVDCEHANRAAAGVCC